MPHMLEIKLRNDKYLVAETDGSSDYKEIYIYLRDNDGSITQDLAVVREAYTINDNLETVPVHQKYEVLVYADEASEDYTHRFEIKEWMGE